MEFGIDKAKLMRYKALAEQHLSDPVKLRLFTAGALLFLITVLVYIPLSRRIDKNGELLIAAKERNSCITDCEKLQEQAMTFRPLIEGKSDISEWISYLLDGLRKFQVKLRGMSPKKQYDVGPYKAAALSMEIEGPYPELKNYIEWVESSKSLVRVDMLQLAQGQNGMSMKILVLGIMAKK
jgi:hypothetical protein